MFDGRVTEDFKLATGTWVNLGGVRSAAIGAGALLMRDLVLTGLDRNYIAALIFPDLAACRRLAQLGAGASGAEIVAHPVVRAAFQERFDAMAANATGSAATLPALLFLQIRPHWMPEKSPTRARSIKGPCSPPGRSCTQIFTLTLPLTMC